MLLHAPAARPAAEDVGMVEEAIEERADGGIDRRTHDALAQRVAEEAPAPDAHVVRDELSAPAFVVVKCRSGGRLARPPSPAPCASHGAAGGRGVDEERYRAGRTRVPVGDAQASSTGPLSAGASRPVCRSSPCRPSPTGRPLCRCDDETAVPPPGGPRVASFV